MHDEFAPKNRRPMPRHMWRAIESLRSVSLRSRNASTMLPVVDGVGDDGAAGVRNDNSASSSQDAMTAFVRIWYHYNHHWERRGVD